MSGLQEKSKKTVLIVAANAKTLTHMKQTRNFAEFCHPFSQKRR
jgi:hypothetical protein